MTKQTALSIITFFVIAFGLTFAFSKLPPIPFYSIDIKDILCGFGPLISGVICYKFFATPTNYSISGTQPLKALLIIFITATTFILTNSKSSFGFNILFALTQIIYCFGEEFGWRHYLQSATNKTNKWLQPFIIGLVWFCWHFSWLQEPLKAMTGQNMNAPLPAVIISAILALTIISFLLGLIMNKTNSVLLPTILHFATKTNMPTIAVALTLVIIATLTWNKFIVEKKVVD
ncbi:MAG: CPBP family intramembrane metalloprotease [Bacteroidetes bacterium]|nr:CPBP family intramembrane metalloprotease [Bacteroidota bacterium]